MNKNIIANSWYNCLILIAVFTCAEILCKEFDLQQKNASLSQKQPFACFDLNISQEELQVLQSLIINETENCCKPHVLNYYGNLAQFQLKVVDYLQLLGNSKEDSLIAAEIIHKIVSDCLSALDLPEAWIAIRAFEPNDLYDIVRWHIDSERLYKINSGFLLKVVCTLKGDSTLLCNVPKNARDEFLKIQTKKYSDPKGQQGYLKRKDIADLLQIYEVESAEPGQGAIFIIGSETIGAIHSEPAIDKDRIFMSIVPGTHEQIQELYNRWHYIIANRF
ncbi:MAG: hypothetical protein JO129_03015 [Candidatus Dependentiae bacterium]|nr:hypothetical protein [Candidatus Dependentiae bacterium]